MFLLPDSKQRIHSVSLKHLKENETKRLLTCHWHHSSPFPNTQVLASPCAWRLRYALAGRPRPRTPRDHSASWQRKVHGTSASSLTLSLSTASYSEKVILLLWCVSYTYDLEIFAWLMASRFVMLHPLVFYPITYQFSIVMICAVE